uniref:Glutaredoxin domain-containing protein n=1 Tax=Romanomermis culicivorax TaxID=13658 RepID=A0A915JEP7_ROMCU
MTNSFKDNTLLGRGIPIAVPGDDIRSSYYNDTMMNTLFKDKALASWPLVLVTRQICPLSIAARKLLDDHHIPYHYYQYDTEPFGIYFVQTSVRKAGTRRLPQVYLCGSYIGASV